jgi:DNA-binding response OmpR family regulator
MPEGFLQGRRVLIVEDDYFLAEDMRAYFEREGAEVVGPVGRVSDALSLATSGKPDGAVLDINLAGEMVYPVADALRARNVPFVFVTGYDAEIIPTAYAEVTRCEKPVEPAKIGKALFSP